MPIFDPAGRVAELEARLAAAEQELSECKARYDELRHRVKNDLQTLSCTFSLQARLGDHPARCAHCTSRLRSIAALYRTLDLTGADLISMSEYLSVLSATLGSQFDGRIVVSCFVEPGIDLDLHRAQRVGMICAEAAMNGAKHAFPDGAEGKIEVRFNRTDDVLEMAVSDDGVGFDPAKAARGHGMDLMEKFARQLDGSLRFEGSPAGTSVKLTFAAPA